MGDAFRHEYVVETVWVLYPGTPYESREIVETRRSSLEDALSWAKHLRKTYAQPDESRADRQYLESAVARTDVIPPDNSPPLDVVLDAIAFREASREED